MAYIYLLSNNSMPGVLKIGCTTRLPESRAAELFSTGVPTPFEVTAFWSVEPTKIKQIEFDVHELLAAYRVHNNREFFRLDLDSAKRRISRFLNKYDEIEKQHEAKKEQHRIDLIKQQEFQKAQELLNTAKNEWVMKRNDYFKKAEVETAIKFGRSLKDIERAEHSFTDYINVLLWIFTLGLAPIVLGFLGINIESDKSVKARLMKNEFLSFRWSIYSGHRKRHFDNYGIACPFSDSEQD